MIDELLIDGNVITLGDKYWALRFRRGMILAALSLEHGRYISAEDLIEHVYGDKSCFYQDARAQIRQHIDLLRRDLEGTDYRIECKRRVGYRLMHVDDDVMVG